MAKRREVERALEITVQDGISILQMAEFCWAHRQLNVFSEGTVRKAIQAFRLQSNATTGLLKDLGLNRGES